MARSWRQPSGRRAQCSPWPGLLKRLSEQPQRRAVRNTILDAKPQKPGERQTVAPLIVDLFVRQIVKRLQHQHPKHHHDVDRLAAGAALLLANRSQNRCLDLCAETLEPHHASNHFQRIALRRNRRKPPVRIEESKLPHRPHARESCCHNSDSHKFAEVFSRCPRLFCWPCLVRDIMVLRPVGLDERRVSCVAVVRERR
jgi:hypothetical protein